MLAMNGDPLPRGDAGRHPQPEAAEMPDGRVEVHGTVGGVTMQVKGHREHGDLHHQQRREHVAPGRQAEQPTVVFE
jgi:hypothetical protein